jgi:hypothetical protein
MEVKREMMKCIAVVFAALLGVSAALAAPRAAEKKPDIAKQILRDKLRADKKFVVAINLPLTEEEGARFWPVYDAYQAELEAIDVRAVDLILAYQDADTTHTLDDKTAKQLAEAMLAIDDDDAKLRHRYFEKMLGLLSPIKTARYFQIEGRIRAANRNEITSKIPLMEEGKTDGSRSFSIGS